MSFTERLNIAMRERRFTQEKLAKSAGMAQSSVWKLVSGKAQATRKLLEIASALKVSPEWLGKGVGEMDIKPSNNDNLSYVGVVTSREIEVKGEAMLGFDGSFEMDESFNGVLMFFSNDPTAFALKVKGDSMFPRINSGEFVVIEPKVNPCSGDEVMVRTSEGKNMIKKLEYHREGEYRFTSINQDHAPITLDESLVEKVYFVAAIVKSSRYKDVSEL